MYKLAAYLYSYTRLPIKRMPRYLCHSRHGRDKNHGHHSILSYGGAIGDDAYLDQATSYKTLRHEQLQSPFFVSSYNRRSVLENKI